MGLNDGLDSITERVFNTVSSPLGAAVGGTIVGGTLVGTAVAIARSGKKKRRRTVRKKAKSRKSRKKKGRRYTPRTAGKRKDRSRKRIRYTKNGQPYVIQANGRARFIKMSSAKRSHKRKGGRY